MVGTVTRRINKEAHRVLGKSYLGAFTSWKYKKLLIHLKFMQFSKCVLNTIQ